jgi:hypothetical protein
VDVARRDGLYGRTAADFLFGRQPSVLHGRRRARVITNLAGPDKINRLVTAVVQYIKNLEKYQYAQEITPIEWPPP